MNMNVILMWLSGLTYPSRATYSWKINPIIASNFCCSWVVDMHGDIVYVWSHHISSTCKLGRYSRTTELPFSKTRKQIATCYRLILRLYFATALEAWPWSAQRNDRQQGCVMALVRRCPRYSVYDHSKHPRQWSICEDTMAVRTNMMISEMTIR